MPNKKKQPSSTLFVAVTREGKSQTHRVVAPSDGRIGHFVANERTLIADAAIDEILDGSYDHVTIYRCVPHTVIRLSKPAARFQIIPINREKKAAS